MRACKQFLWNEKNVIIQRDHPRGIVMSFCLCCGVELEDKAKKRRLLSGGNEEIHSELGVFLKAFVTEDEADGLVNNSNGYICRQCYMKYEQSFQTKPRWQRNEYVVPVGKGNDGFHLFLLYMSVSEILCHLYNRFLHL